MHAYNEKEHNKAVNQLWNEKVTLPNFIKDNPNFRNNEEGLERFNKILSILDADVVKELSSRFMTQSFAEGFCESQLETGGGCSSISEGGANINDYRSQRNSYSEEAEEERTQQAIGAEGYYSLMEKNVFYPWINTIREVFKKEAPQISLYKICFYKIKGLESEMEEIKKIFESTEEQDTEIAKIDRNCREEAYDKAFEVDSYTQP